ncbi:Receptor-like serine/threonine-protein kinase ALE2 [Cucurbita argyrosperma subsp. argyrosperma]|nr:Receptor-like serine/threonine-protein kinase ALE2 [Cucurbita argyrosperma subsp. argyrosperma]
MKSVDVSYEFGTLMGFRLLFLLFEICFAVGSFSVCEAADHAVTPTSHVFGRKHHGKSDNALFNQLIQVELLALHFHLPCLLRNGGMLMHSHHSSIFINYTIQEGSSNTKLHSLPIMHRPLPIPAPTTSPMGSYKKKKSMPPSQAMMLPPPPPNGDCTISCTEPLTYTPPGMPCGCVWPIQVKISLDVAVYTFFPLVSELAEEIAIKASLFGRYQVLDVKYPGLPPSPPSAPLGTSSINDGLNTSNTNAGNAIKPLGVDVPRRRKEGLGRNMIVVITISSFTAFVMCVGLAWVCLLRCRVPAHHPAQVPHNLMASPAKPPEVEMLSRLHHRNLVKLIGICTEDRNRCLVYELVPNGSVESHLHAPEYAMTGHLLVKSDVYSYGVVLLELLTGRKPVDLSLPPGQENLVAWARPLLTSKEGLDVITDPAIKSDISIDSLARVAAIASMCVQPEVSHRPFMGEVVQALKLVCSEFEKVTDQFHEVTAETNL